MSKKADSVELPYARDLNGLWDYLGFKLREGSNPARLEYVPTGVYRRFAAGLGAFRNRGFGERQLRLDRDRLHFVSRGGQFSPRKIRVDTTVEFDVRSATLACDSTQLIVHSQGDDRYRTTYTGAHHFLDQLIAQRLSEMLAVIGARHTEGTTTLTYDEWADCSDIHPYPRKAWATDTGRLVLVDDSSSWRVPPYGRGWFLSTGDTAAQQAKLRRIGWQLVAK